MEDKILCGVAIGLVSGMLIATHSSKTRSAVETGEEQLLEKAKKLVKQSNSKKK